MARITVDVEDVDLPGDHGGLVKGVKVTCGECDHETESFGSSQRSVKRCLALLREECPRNEENYYVDADIDDRRP